MIFSITASIITVIFDNILKFIFFKNSISEEAEKKNKILSREIRKENNIELKYQQKLKRGFSKLKVIISLAGKKLSKNLIVDENNFQNNFKNDRNNKNNLIKKNLNNLPNILESETDSILLKNCKINKFTENIDNRKIINRLEISENIIEEKILKIENIENFKIYSSTINDHKIKRKYTTSESSYTSKSNNFYGISNCNLQILCLKPESNLKLKLRSNLKMIIIFSLFFVLWFFDFVLLQSIYEQFGSNILKMCFFPFISTILVKNLITINVMIFLNTIVLFFYGKYILIQKKKHFILNLILIILVSPLSLEQYSALMIHLYMVK